GRIVLNPTGEVEVESVPAGLISKPTLMWDIKSGAVADVPVELSYVSHGLNWNADYVITLNGQGKGDIQGWVSLSNSSGATWHNAKLKLLAGDVHTIEPQSMIDKGLMEKSDVVSGNLGMVEESLFEYHLYTLERPAEIRNNETKQLALLQGQNVPIEKRLIIDSIAYSYYPSEGEVGTGNIKPQVRLEFVNNKESGLGMPLPKGKIRVYQRDRSGSVQLLGEDTIEHTPRNERVSVVVGRSFDVVANRRRTNFTRLNARDVRETFEVEARNRKETPVTVHIFERHWFDWRITKTSQAWQKLDSNTAEYVVDLKPNEVKKVLYTVETRW
ncbi:MAG: hypothetical protein P4L46_13930, partial [Fimbriimonas sp.]|nr:hypothetical protein [Fimbriimonas sp.]